MHLRTPPSDKMRGPPNDCAFARTRSPRVPDWWQYTSFTTFWPESSATRAHHLDVLDDRYADNGWSAANIASFSSRRQNRIARPTRLAALIPDQNGDYPPQSATKGIVASADMSDSAKHALESSNDAHAFKRSRIFR